jgi:hypothetical protein
VPTTEARVADWQRARSACQQAGRALRRGADALASVLRATPEMDDGCSGGETSPPQALASLPHPGFQLWGDSPRFSANKRSILVLMLRCMHPHPRTRLLLCVMGCTTCTPAAKHVRRHEITVPCMSAALPAASARSRSLKPTNSTYSGRQTGQARSKRMYSIISSTAAATVFVRLCRWSCPAGAPRARPAAPHAK